LKSKRLQLLSEISVKDESNCVKQGHIHVVDRDAVTLMESEVEKT